MPNPKKVELTPEQQAILDDYNRQVALLKTTQAQQMSWQNVLRRRVAPKTPAALVLGGGAAIERAYQADVTARMVQAELERLTRESPWVEAWSPTGQESFMKTLSQRVARGEMTPQQAQAEADLFRLRAEELAGQAAEEAAAKPADYTGKYGPWAANLKDTTTGTPIWPASTWNLMSEEQQEVIFQMSMGLPTTEDKGMTEYQREQVRLQNAQLLLEQQAAERQAAAQAAANQMTEYQRADLAQRREQAQQQAYLQTHGLAQNLGQMEQSAWETALPWTLPSGTQYAPGFAPGGPVAQLYRAGGASYTPTPMQPYNPPNMQALYAMLQQAVNRFGGM